MTHPTKRNLHHEASLAQFALLSLYFTTKKQLADDDSAKAFFDALGGRVPEDRRPDPYDVPRLIEFARLGERELEKQISLLRALQSQEPPC
jgi:hypothetical protein